MQTFKMNSLVGEDAEGNDIIIRDESWIPLDEKIYVGFFNEVKRDNGHTLTDLIQLCPLMPLVRDSLEIHFVEYDLPMVVIVSPQTIEDFANHLESGTPGMVADKDKRHETAVCHRNRLPSSATGLVCLFPVIIMAVSPPQTLSASALLAHEMVHFRHTLSPRYAEHAIRLTCFNANMQDFCRNNFPQVLRGGIISCLEEEWEACDLNFDEGGKQRAFTNIYIPAVLASCASKLDWWLNDEGRYLNIGRTSTLISETLFSCLKNLGYKDISTQYPMDPERWKNVAERCLREAYGRWQRNPGPFVEKLSEALAS